MRATGAAIVRRPGKRKHGHQTSGQCRHQTYQLGHPTKGDGLLEGGALRRHVGGKFFTKRKPRLRFKRKTHERLETDRWGSAWPLPFVPE